jgi:hypothetical protein
MEYILPGMLMHTITNKYPMEIISYVTQLHKLRLIFLIIFFNFSLYQKLDCQRHVFGLKMSIYAYNYSGYGVVGNWDMVTQINGRLGSGISLDYRFDHSWFYLGTELGATNNTSIFYPQNLTPENDYDGTIVFSTMYATSQINVGLTQVFGVQIPAGKIQFRGFCGLTPSIQFNTGDEDSFNRARDEINLSIYKSYEPFVLFGHWGMAVDYWKMRFEIKREYSLTPIIESIEYKGETYDFNYNQNRLYLTLGFNFYPWKIKDHSPKPLI